MISNIDSQSLTMVQTLSDACTIIYELRDKICSLSPSDLIDELNGVENKVKELESKISMVISSTGMLKSLYTSAFSRFKDLRNSLSVKINEHKLNELPFNTSGTFYDESQLLKEIYVTSVNQIQPGINNVVSDEVLEAKEYSCLSIINKFYNERNLLDELTEIARNLCTTFESIMRSYNSQLLEVKEMINNPDVVMQLSENSAEAASKIKELINGYTFRIERTRNDFIKLFNVYLDVKNNYAIYQVVVTDYASVVVESLFNIESTYEIC